MNVLVKTAAWCSDDANREAAFALWAKAGKSREEMERNWTAMPLKLRYSPLLDAHYYAELRRYIEDARRFEMIDADVSVDNWAEPKYLLHALEELELQDFWPARDAAGKIVSAAGL